MTAQSARIAGKITAITLGVATAAAGLATALPTAHAADNGIAAKGKVVAKTTLAEHSAPSTSAPISGNGYKKGTVLKLDCNLNGTKVDGNDVWYRVAGKHSWVAARYVQNIGHAPIACTAASAPVTGKATATVSLRQAPTTHDRTVGHISKGKTAHLWCKVASQKIDGNHTWYQESNGWVSAKYIKTSKSVPYCSQL
ncbi:hypothetical protein FOE78_16275 [Microlunatus elymi]|uniref:SH3 domain-containing protein n=1 Tax=Microlunatus elymi TaxID=2596828 RepID=A0A516Q1G4_9ACTN|nr:hypothetical protein [Microlunatus elymi]QDP97273.1 hypothetical protein FOE78_16275 [Microlunatus elymi]